MKALHRKLALGLAIGVASVGMFGAAALGAFGLEVSSSVGSAIAPVGSVLGAEKPDKFKGILDALVQKGVITQQQEDAILVAMKDAAGIEKASDRVHVMRDLFGAAAQYLGTTEKDLRAKLPGTSLGKIADGMAPAKSRAGLVAALTTAANADIDKAVADKRITADQATTLRSKVAGEITSLVEADCRRAGAESEELPRRDVEDRSDVPRTFGNGHRDRAAERSEPGRARERDQAQRSGQSHRRPDVEREHADRQSRR